MHPAAESILKISAAPRLSALLARLLQSYESAAGSSPHVGKHADEILALRRLGMHENDLRWLVRRGFVAPAEQDDESRSHGAAAHGSLAGNTRVALTSHGAQIARELLSRQNTDGAKTSSALRAPVEDAAHPTDAWRRPSWDRNRGELKLGAVVVKRLKMVAADEEVVLAAFEELGWPSTIDGLLPAAGDVETQRRLLRTIEALNSRQLCALVRFRAEPNGRGVRWELRDGSPAVEA